MTWKKYITPNQCSLVLFEVCKWDREIYFSWPYILSDYKLEAKFWGVVDVSILYYPFVVHCDFGIMTEEVGNSF